MSQEHIVILGNGIAGITAAREIRKRSDHRITVISAESDHFFSRTALMYIYMGHMTFENTKPYEDGFWEKNEIHLERAYVEHVDTENRRLHLGGGRHIGYDKLILATGSKSNKFGWPGQDLPGVQGLYSLQDLDSMEKYTAGIDHAVVIGGGLIGIEMCEMLHSRGIHATFLVREKSWMDFAYPAEESEMINREIREHGIDLRLGTELDRIEADDQGRAALVVTKDGDRIPAPFVGLTVGVSPNVDFLKSSGIELGRGIKVDQHLETSVPGIYAIGDCAEVREPEPGRRPIEPLWYTGRAMGQTVARLLCGETLTYDPGLWFNSAKFFDLEWQVYGQVPAQLPEDQDTLFWQHAKKPLAIRINSRRSDGAVTGFQLMGIRYRHEVCHEWLEQERPLRWVLENLGVANFDPEFYKQYEEELIRLYNQQHPEDPVRLRRTRGLRGLFQLRRAS
jgi:NAD(P)H-nitrite reductase large subunit